MTTLGEVLAELERASAMCSHHGPQGGECPLECFKYEGCHNLPASAVARLLRACLEGLEERLWVSVRVAPAPDPEAWLDALRNEISPPESEG